MTAPINALYDPTYFERRVSQKLFDAGTPSQGLFSGSTVSILDPSAGTIQGKSSNPTYLYDRASHYGTGATDANGRVNIQFLRDSSYGPEDTGNQH